MTPTGNLAGLFLRSDLPTREEPLASLLANTSPTKLKREVCHPFATTQVNLHKGLKTLEDARFYTASTTFDEFSNKGKTLVLQYSLKQDQNIDCGGGYVKLHPAGLDQANYDGDSVYKYANK